MTLLEIVTKYKTIQHIGIPCDFTECSLEQALADLDCQSNDFLVYISASGYAEAVKIIALTLAFNGHPVSATNNVIICKELSRDAWFCGYKDKAIFSPGA